MTNRNHSSVGRSSLNRSSVIVAAAVLAVAGAAHAEAAPDHAEARALVARGQIAARAGQPADAWKLFAEAWRVDHGNADAVRWICRLALTFGPHDAATGACREAFMLGRQPEDMRNRVASWVRSPIKPTMEELVSATFMADGAVRKAPNEPWGQLAKADLALRLRDPELLAASLSELERIAPEHPQVRRLAELAAPHASRAAWLGRLAVLFSLICTALHALWTGRPRRARRRALAVATALAALLGSARGAAAASPNPLVPPPLPTIDDKRIEESLVKAEAVNPLAFSDGLMVVIDRAQKADARGDHATAARYWTAVTHAVPDRAYGFARLCEAQQAAGAYAAALDACRAAITQDGSTVGDYTHFVRLVLAKPGALTTDDRRQIGVAIAALEKEPKAAADGAELESELALRDGNIPALRAAAGKLVALAPENAKTIFYKWTLAFDARDRLAAEALVSEARARGLKADVIARMEAATVALPLPAATRAVRWGLAGAGVFALGYLLWIAARRLRARVRAEARVVAVGRGVSRVF